MQQLSTLGNGLVNSVINRLPFELHIPGYQFCGPGTRLTERLQRGEQGINQLDSACRDHDISYSQSNNLSNRHIADRILAKKARERIIASDANLGEKAAAAAVWSAMKVKTKLGMGLHNKRKRKVQNKIRKKTILRKRFLPIAKRGGLLPILPLLGALGSLVGGAATVAKAVSDRKSAQKQLAELQRHNKAMEGRGLFIRPYTRGGGTRKIKKKIHRKRY